MKKILAAAAAFAIATGSVVTGAGAHEHHAMKAPGYNPTYCILFLPFLCFPPETPKAQHHSHKAHKTKH